MPTRHKIDLSLKFDRNVEPPSERRIEIAEQQPVPKTRPKTRLVEREPYRASAALEEVVNLAIALGRPLLLQGDPGCGKTRLAHAVAYALGLPIEECYIKSTTRAQDLLYTYDAVRRLYDSQLRSGGRTQPLPPIEEYVRFGPFGRTIIRAMQGRRSVLLIDEIDKADLDFPNDLLREIDRLEFEVAEAGDMHFSVPAGRPDLRPIIFVTHNEEKPLPGAFLRRCIFHFVSFPDQELDQILVAHDITDPAVRRKAIEVVDALRKRDLVKKPGLSELLDWVGYLQAAGIDPGQAPTPGLPALLKTAADARQVQDGATATAS
jgi:MoxR-like ATPase